MTRQELREATRRHECRSCRTRQSDIGRCRTDRSHVVTQSVEMASAPSGLADKLIYGVDAAAMYICSWSTPSIPSSCPLISITPHAALGFPQLVHLCHALLELHVLALLVRMSLVLGVLLAVVSGAGHRDSDTSHFHGR